MVKVKICGVKKLEEVEFLNKLRPDYIGFVFAESKRKVSIEQAKILSKALDTDIKKVGVFVNQDIGFVNLAAKSAALDIVQLHGKEEQSYIDKVEDAEIWKAMGVSDDSFKTKLHNYRVQGILLDSVVKGMHGGSGVSFNWELASELSKDRTIILAGGLQIDNIAEAIKLVKPFAVDVSSSVEGLDGKDYDKCRKFIEEVRKA